MKNFGKPATQATLSKWCGVSRSTVAAVIRNGAEAKRLSPEVREKVMLAIRKFNYRPHSVGQAMRSGKNRTIAFAVPNMDVLGGRIHMDIFIGIGERAQALGYNVMICAYKDKDGILFSFRNFYLESRFDGIFFYGSDDNFIENQLSGLEKPFVVLEHLSHHSPSLSFDNFDGGVTAVQHLINHGRQRIAFLGDSEVSNYAERKAGYIKALQDNGIEFDPKLVQPLVFTGIENFPETGYQGIMRLLKQKIRFDAVFCITDMTALAAMQVLQNKKKQVPKDVAVVGFDDTPMASLSIPALSTVRQNARLLGKKAMDVLKKLIEQKKVATKPVVLPCEFVPRQSCGCSR